MLTCMWTIGHATGVTRCRKQAQFAGPCPHGPHAWLLCGAHLKKLVKRGRAERVEWKAIALVTNGPCQCCP